MLILSQLTYWLGVDRADGVQKTKNISSNENVE